MKNMLKNRSNIFFFLFAILLALTTLNKTLFSFPKTQPRRFPVLNGSIQVRKQNMYHPNYAKSLATSRQNTNSTSVPKQMQTKHQKTNQKTFLKLNKYRKFGSVATGAAIGYGCYRQLGKISYFQNGSTSSKLIRLGVAMIPAAIGAYDSIRQQKKLSSSRKKSTSPSVKQTLTTIAAGILGAGMSYIAQNGINETKQDLIKFIAVDRLTSLLRSKFPKWAEFYDRKDFKDHLAMLISNPCEDALLKLASCIATHKPELVVKIISEIVDSLEKITHPGDQSREQQAATEMLKNASKELVSNIENNTALTEKIRKIAVETATERIKACIEAQASQSPSTEQPIIGMSEIRAVANNVLADESFNATLVANALINAAQEQKQAIQNQATGQNSLEIKKMIQNIAATIEQMAESDRVNEVKELLDTIKRQTQTDKTITEQDITCLTNALAKLGTKLDKDSKDYLALINLMWQKRSQLKQVSQSPWRHPRQTLNLWRESKKLMNTQSVPQTERTHSRDAWSWRDISIPFITG